MLPQSKSQMLSQLGMQLKVKGIALFDQNHDDVVGFMNGSVQEYCFNQTRGRTTTTRGNHQPVHRYYEPDGTETRAGTTGIYSNPHGELITGGAKLGHVAGFGFFGVPEQNNVNFEVFPGAPSVTKLIQEGVYPW